MEYIVLAVEQTYEEAVETLAQFRKIGEAGCYADIEQSVTGTSWQVVDYRYI